MLERGKQQRLALKVGYRFLVLLVVEVRLDHLLDCARCFPQIPILGEIDSAHSTAADPANDLVTAVQDLSRRQRLRLGPLFSAGVCAGGHG